MKIKKIGHCCLVIDVDGVRVVTDPGMFTQESHKDITNIDMILITHEHGDHIHTESLKEMIANNPDAKVITNSSVGKLLEESSIEYETLEGNATTEIKGLTLEAFDAKHEEIFEEFGIVQNTGFFIGEKLFYPGDAYCNPGKHVDVLALPVAGPWCRIGDVIRYAIEVKPNKTFPVHDGMLTEVGLNGQHGHVNRELTSRDIEFISMKAGDEQEF